MISSMALSKTGVSHAQGLPQGYANAKPPGRNKIDKVANAPLLEWITSSIIDLCLTNHPWNFSDSGVTDIGISVCNKKDLYPQIKSEDCNKQML